MFPWNKTFNAIEAPGGDRTCFELPFPAACRINRVVVIQTGGPLGVFTVRFFNNRLPCSLGSQSSGGDDADGVYEASPETYEVFKDPLVSNAGGEAQWEDPTGILYENTDGTLSTREYKIYVEITSVGLGDKTFDIKFGCNMGQE